MIEYTLGLIFTKEFREVLLIHRNEHDFHAFKYNGVGGKILLGESPVECMIRETKEEAGIETSEKDWKFVAILKAPSWKVWVFATMIKDVVDTFPEIREGKLEWHMANNLPKETVSNISWLIPLSRDIYTNPELQNVVGWYTDPQKE